MGRLINTAVVPGTTAPRVRMFLHGHDTLPLPHGHFAGGGGATPFVHLPQYELNEGRDEPLHDPSGSKLLHWKIWSDAMT